MHEWPLLIFTLLVQTAIGGMLALSIYVTLINKNEQNVYSLVKLPLIVISIISIIGLAASFTHLGTPMHALYTITNLKTSWFSREIIFVGAFIGLTVLTTAWVLVKKEVQTILLYVTSFIGLCAVFVMASIYVNALIPAWDGIGTYIIFYAAALLTGTTLVAALCKPFEKITTILFSIALFTVGMKLIFLPMHYLGINSIELAQQPFYYGQFIFNVLGIALFAYLTFTRKNMPLMIWAVTILMIIGEFLGRYAFFMNAI